MGSYAQVLNNADALRQMQRQQMIAANQDATLNIAGVLRTGKHPDTGADLTPAEVMQLTQRHKELTAQTADLFNPRQDPNKMGKQTSVASGVAQPEGLLHKATDALHLTKPPVSTDTTRSPSQVMQDLQAISQQYRTQPGQNEAAAAQTELQSKLKGIEASDLSPEDKLDAKRRAMGVTSTSEKQLFKKYKMPDGSMAWLDAAHPDRLPEGAKLADTETADTRARSDFDKFKKDNPEYKGSFEQWKTEQGSKGRELAKPESLDHEYQAILVKKSAGRPLSPDEKAHEAAWQAWNYQKNIAPGVAKAAAFGANRYIMVNDPNQLGRVIPMRAGDAAKAGADTPQGIAFKTDMAITKWATTGDGATKINNFNTAIDHLKLLQEASNALHNGDTQLFNKWANQFGTATGSATPSNFDSVKAAVAGEISKTFSSATIPEIEAISTTINNAESPEQVSGAIDYYTRLMNGKMGALKEQYEQGKKGKPNFPSDVDDIVKALKNHK